ncbi:MAG TPA: hypothetical protein DEB25_02310 [Desulfobulbaceae bacterium]|nr:hypothetical protein [Desulfobulbaceae bacterium]
MKKKLATLLILASLTVAGAAAAVTQPAPDAAAQPQVMMYNPRMAMQMDPAMWEKMQQFYNSTEGLRKQIIMKRAELNAIVNAAQPDPATASKIAGDLYDLQASLRKQAQAAGLGQFGPGCGMGMGMGNGFGPGFGHHHGGFGRW